MESIFYNLKCNKNVLGTQETRNNLQHKVFLIMFLSLKYYNELFTYDYLSAIAQICNIIRRTLEIYVNISVQKYLSFAGFMLFLKRE